MTPEERALRASIAANRRWAFEPDRRAATAPARRAADERFEREVDPAGTLPADERARRAASLRRAWFQSLALRSVAARRRNAAAAEAAAVAPLRRPR